MAGKQAKVLSRKELDRVLEFVDEKHPGSSRERVMVLLAVRAGLRASEIARLTWEMVLDPNGDISDTLDIRDTIAKKGRGRRVPIHPQLRLALKKLRACSDGPINSPVIASRRGGGLKPNSLVNWFIATCRLAGLDGCSSHSGRRTFITRAARCAHRAGATLRDVQILAGHASIETTQLYIEGSSEAQHRLISRL